MLLILILLPAIAMVVIWVYCRVGQEVLLTALAFSILNLVHTLFIMHLFDPSTAAFQFQALGR